MDDRADEASPGVLVTGWLRVAPDDRDAYLAASVPAMEAAATAPGCLAFRLSPDPLDDGLVLVHEAWVDAAVVERFRTSEGPELDLPPVLDAAVHQHVVTDSDLLT